MTTIHMGAAKRLLRLSKDNSGIYIYQDWIISR